VKKGKEIKRLFPDWKNLRVLAVDDDPVILEYFRDFVGRYDAVCDTALSANDAYRLIEKNGAYDIYFTDLKMPDIDGMEFTRDLKAKYDHKAYVIMMSATEWSTIEQRAIEAGVDNFLSKPIFPSNIVDTINKFVGVNQEKIEEAHEAAAQQFEGHCILLAEDIEINCEIVMALLEPTLLKIDCAENGKEAVRMFGEAPDKYDMIFMDVQMPEMDGYEATRKIRSLDIPGAKDIPIIAMTANVFREDVEKCLEAGMNDHVGKPIDFDEVIKILCKYLSDI
jgi:CheY-like chemotaxis protein